MVRLFNRAGPCEPENNYMIPPEARLPAARPLIDQGAYFEVYSGRYIGKTTALFSLAQQLTREGKYVAILVSMSPAALFPGDIDGAERSILESWRSVAGLELPPELQPPPFPDAPPGARIKAALKAWAREAPRPLVVFLDDVEELRGDVLVSVLRQIRSGFAARPRGFPHSLALIGVSSVRDAKVPAGGADALEPPSSFDILSDSLHLEDFTRDEVAALFAQHTADTEQPFLPEAVDRVFEITEGQPLMLAVLAHQIVKEVVKDRAGPITVADVSLAMETPIVS